MKKESIPMEIGTLCFQCNLCGAKSIVPVSQLTRESASCSSCKSNARRRALIRALLSQLRIEEQVLAFVEPNKSIVGLGMSDPDDYAERLAGKFTYQNTFLHQEPYLDIGASELPRDLVGRYDFVVCSEVLEHVTPPVARAFKNVFDLLKPDGIFVLTVPYGLQEKTAEHFPELNDFSVTLEGDGYVLRNVTKQGVTQQFGNLIFHGGPGVTLEMRIFAEKDLLRLIKESGFGETTVHRYQELAWGITWPEPWSFPITAKKS